MFRVIRTLIFLGLLSWCSIIAEPKATIEPINSGVTVGIYGEIIPNFWPITNPTRNLIINDLTYRDIFSGTYLFDSIVVWTNCYHPMISLTSSWKILLWDCLADSISMSGSWYPIYWVKNNSWFVSTDPEFFSTLKQNNSSLINNYLRTLYDNSDGVVVLFRNGPELITTRQYKKWILSLRLYDTAGFWLKYWLFDGRQYDFSFNADEHDELGFIPYDSYTDFLKKQWCWNKYNWVTLNHQCYNNLPLLFDEVSFSWYVSKVEEIIDKMY